MTRACFILIITCVTSAFATDEDFVAKVTRVIDGNTFEVTSVDGEVQRLVLAGIDAPEHGQPYAEKAKKLLEDLILDREVKVTVQGKNRHCDGSEKRKGSEN
jgi:endonuclease YncB( thermonuclease family)